MKYAWITKYKIDFQITQMCKVLKVDRASYYHWVRNGSLETKIDKTLDSLIMSIFKSGRNRYGTRPIQANLLNNYGIILSRKKTKFRFHC